MIDRTLDAVCYAHSQSSRWRWKFWQQPAIEHKLKYSVGSNPWWQKWPYDHQHERDEHNFKWIHIAKKSHHRHHVGSAEARMQHNQSKKMSLFLIHCWYIVHHVLGLVDAWSDESERFRKKYVFPPPPISPDSLIRATEERNKSARREREQYNARGKAQRTGLGCKTLRKGLM